MWDKSSCEGRKYSCNHFCAKQINNKNASLDLFARILANHSSFKWCIASNICLVRFRNIWQNAKTAYWRYETLTVFFCLKTRWIASRIIKAGGERILHIVEKCLTGGALLLAKVRASTPFLYPPWLNRAMVKHHVTDQGSSIKNLMELPYADQSRSISRFIERLWTDRTTITCSFPANKSGYFSKSWIMLRKTMTWLV